MSDQNDSDAYLPSHSLQMRRAAEDVRQGIEKLRTKMACDYGADVFARMHVSDRSQQDRKIDINGLFQSAWMASQKCKEFRDSGLHDVHKRLCSGSNALPIDTVRVQEDGSSWYAIQPAEDNCRDTSTRTTQMENNAYQFKQQYCSRNVPCVIRGLDRSHLADISSQWRSDINHPVGAACGDDNLSLDNDVFERSDASNVNAEWFRCFVGNDTLVPVCIDNFDTHHTDSSDHNGLDEDGRAEEYETKTIRLEEWIVLCREQYQHNDSNAIHHMHKGYLKDWHLVQYLYDKQNDCPNEPSQTLPLYTTPNFFERDLLNNFLQRYGDGADYKFVYWGPAGSQTRLHSDVLHSFSWSYNVVGLKRWIFHVPTCYNGRINLGSRDKSFQVMQETGEAIFVPSTWKHEVVNLAETLSINHNWVTAANIDLSWRCLVVEIAAIEVEVKKWGEIPEDDFAARENMLRGCTGVNVSMFTLMVLLETVEQLLILIDSTYDDEFIDNRETSSRIWDIAYNIFCLQSALKNVMNKSSTIQRLEAILESQTMALSIKDCAKETIKYVSLMQQTSNSSLNNL